MQTARQKNKMNHKPEKVSRGRYHNDYSPRYQEPYDIYEKAKRHMQQRRKEERRNKAEEAADEGESARVTPVSDALSSDI